MSHPIDTSDSKTLFSILLGAHATQQRTLERHAKHLLEQDHGIVVRFKRSTGHDAQREAPAAAAHGG